MQPITIYFLSAPCGSGKTHTLIKYAVRLANEGHRVLFFQPTKELINKTVEHELSKIPDHRRPRYKVFHGDTVEGPVSGRLTQFLSGTDDDGQIIFCRTQCIPYVPFWANKNGWCVIIDEEIQVVRHLPYELPQNHTLITGLVDLQNHSPIYSHLIVKDHARLEAIAKNENHDQVDEIFCDLAQTLVLPHWDSYVNTEHYNKLLAGSYNTLSVHSILNPGLLAGFRSVIIACANFKDTLLYNLWTQKGVLFKEDATLASTLKFTQHKNGHLVTIKYAVTRDWSKKQRVAKLEPTNKNSLDVQGAIIEAVKTEFRSQPFLWQANKSFEKNRFEPNAIRLPNAPHGLNEYSSIDDIVFLSSLNPPSDHFAFLKSQGVDPEDVKKAIYHSTVYQSCLRTSLRDPESESSETIIVPDLATAKYLHDHFRGSTLVKLSTAIPEQEVKKRGRLRIHASDKERKTAYNRQKRQEMLNQLFELDCSLFVQESLLDQINTNKSKD